MISKTLGPKVVVPIPDEDKKLVQSLHTLSRELGVIQSGIAGVYKHIRLADKEHKGWAKLAQKELVDPVRGVLTALEKYTGTKTKH